MKSTGTGRETIHSSGARDNAITIREKFGASPNIILYRCPIEKHMEPGNGLDLSPRKVAYIKYIFERGVTVKTNDLASHFAVDPSTITKTMSELAESGLLAHEPYRGVSLSEKGKCYAEFLVKRHRILSLALTHYGLSHDEACREVSRFESLVSKETIDTMCRAMGHPHTGICGEITHDPGCLETGTRT